MMATILELGDGFFIAGDPPAVLDLGEHWCDWCLGDGLEDYGDGLTLCGGCDGRGVRVCEDTACRTHSALHPAL
jgi:hypothetical protein